MTESDRETLKDSGLFCVGMAETIRLGMSQPGESIDHLRRIGEALVAIANRKPPEGTVRVRAACAVNAKGHYSVSGWNNAGDSELQDVVFEGMDFAGGQLLQWLEADVPKPSPTTIPAEVQHAK